MRFLIAAGTTRTAEIEDISAAAAEPELAAHTPAADVELVTYGRTIRAPRVPVSPTGCPTPALVTRAVRERLAFEPLVLDAGLASPTAAPTVDLDAEPGADIREPVPVPGAESIFAAARKLGRALPDEELVVGESIPGGTTTALGVQTALGEPHGVSSSLPENPVDLKRSIVSEGCAASDIEPGDAAGDPVEAIRLMGDPVLAVVTGIAAGALRDGRTVMLAGGTQMVAVAALLRHAGVDEPIEIATTSFVDADDAAELRSAAEALDLDLTVTDPGFAVEEHPALEGFARGEAKEGVGMGGALALADREGVSMSAVRQRTIDLYESCMAVDDGP